MQNIKSQILKHVGMQIKTFRRNLGYSRAAVAAYLGMTPRTLASYERGEREISVETVIKIAEFYGTTFNSLTDYQNIMNKIRMEGI